MCAIACVCVPSDGITSLPIDTLLHGGTDPSYSSTEYFVQHYVETKQFIMQLIVSRAQRFAATEYHVAPVRADGTIIRCPPHTIERCALSTCGADAHRRRGSTTHACCVHV